MENKKILFLAPYPTDKNKREGMMQRVVAVDNIFNSNNRTYLHIKNKYRLSSYKKVDNIHIYELNGLLHPFKIYRLLKKADIIYSHSIYGFYNLALLLFPFFKNKLILDAHGIVPEEMSLAKDSLREFIFAIIERLIFSICHKVIVVTKAMQNHFKNKYPSKTRLFFTYPIISSSVKKMLKLDLSYQDDDIITVLYSGNSAVYQNIDMMLQFISNNIHNSIIYILLTPDTEIFKEKLTTLGIYNSPTIILKSVSPEELPLYYAKAHYGFILRDNINVNSVANPTKMGEYLAAGITPIVITPNIGDYCNYDYLVFKNLNISCLKPIKSERNRLLIKTINSNINPLDFINFINK